jgi:phospholipid-translocating ATPase
MLLRGCFLKNTPYAIGVVIYVGNESKIMMNAKKPPSKISNMMKKMNVMLYTVFLFQLAIIITFASLGVSWMSKNSSYHIYLHIHDEKVSFGKFV